ncbi:MAG: hypothetical protein AABY22_15760 [Nanoarchaeota archaeon]
MTSTNTVKNSYFHLLDGTIPEWKEKIECIPATENFSGSIRFQAAGLSFDAPNNQNRQTNVRYVKHLENYFDIPIHKIELKKEPTNQYDKFAIKIVSTLDKEKFIELNSSFEKEKKFASTYNYELDLGYLPKTINQYVHKYWNHLLFNFYPSIDFYPANMKKSEEKTTFQYFFLTYLYSYKAKYDKYARFANIEL